MKKIFIFTTMVFLLVGNTEVFASKGNFEKAKKYHNSAVISKQKFGENDKKVLDLYTKAINEYQNVSVPDKNIGEAYHYLARILFTGPKSLINNELSLKYFLTASFIFQKESCTFKFHKLKE